MDVGPLPDGADDFFTAHWAALAARGLYWARRRGVGVHPDEVMAQVHQCARRRWAEFADLEPDQVLGRLTRILIDRLIDEHRRHGRGPLGSGSQPADENELAQNGAGPESAAARNELTGQIRARLAGLGLEGEVVDRLGLESFTSAALAQFLGWLDALPRLREDDRRVLLLRLRGLSFAEMAAALKVRKEDAVRQRVHRAQVRLNDLVRRNGGSAP
jgi:DNA-directed RNA polymerase specialized sigma24 family protein